jgi:hypothetical protein
MRAQPEDFSLRAPRPAGRGAGYNGLHPVATARRGRLHAVMLLKNLLHDDRFAGAAPRLRRGAAVYAPTFFAPYVLAALVAARDGGRLVVAPDAEAAAALAAELGVYLEREVAGAAGARRALRRRRGARPARGRPAPAGARRRSPAGDVVVADAVALLERFLPLELQPEPLILAVGEETPSTTTSSGWPRSATGASSRSAGAASSRCAAASSTSTPRSASPSGRVLGRRGRAAAHLLGLLAAHRGRRRARRRLRRLRG